MSKSGETVLQIARKTGRDLIQVNISDIKSMWVGESEKNIKGIFDDYRKMVKQSAKTPILLFNEADAIIGKRMVGAEKAVDKLENNIQNIILQEIEQLDGILLTLTMRHPSWIFLFFGGRIVTFAPV